MSAAPGLLLRTATAGDAALLATMHATSRMSAYRGMLPDRYLDHEAMAEAQAIWPAKLRDLLAGAGEAMIVEANGTPVAFLCVMTPDEQGSVYIDNLHAMPGHKGAGAGRLMLEAGRRWALARGATGLHLLVLEANVDAIGFYEKHGWQFDEKVPDNIGGADIVALSYVLPLAPGGDDS